jgi:hypothetical protein
MVPLPAVGAAQTISTVTEEADTIVEFAGRESITKDGTIAAATWQSHINKEGHVTATNTTPPSLLQLLAVSKGSSASCNGTNVTD